MRFILRMGLLGVALVAVAASATSQNTGTGYQSTEPSPPASRAMDISAAFGLWQSSFGPVKLELDPAGQDPQMVHGVWRYMRESTEVLGVFWGRMDGNVLQFSWQEPLDNGGQLEGAGYLVFRTDGSSFSGRWWTKDRARRGGWDGWRHDQDPAGDRGQDNFDDPRDEAQPRPDTPAGPDGQPGIGEPPPPGDGPGGTETPANPDEDWL